MEFLHFDLPELIKAVGYIGIFAIVFAESGLLFGFFLPGDSLLFTAGFLASQGFLNIVYLSLLCFVAAVLGDSVGYWFGHRVGRKLFNRENSLLFDKKNLVKAELFYEKHGGKTIIIARFLPFVRTFAPIVAGIGKMDYRKFLAYNLIGGAFWGIGLTIAGYYLGTLFQDVDKYLLPIIGIIVLVSVLPTGLHLLKEYQKSKRTVKLES